MIIKAIGSVLYSLYYTYDNFCVTKNADTCFLFVLCIKFKIMTLWLLTQLYVMAAFYSRIEIT